MFAIPHKVHLVTYLSKWMKLRVHWSWLREFLCCSFPHCFDSFSSCVVSSMCIPNMEFQRVNPTTQVALFSVCSENCSSIRNITWKVYQGSNTSLSTMNWTLFRSMDQYENIWFFGKSHCGVKKIELIDIILQVHKQGISQPSINYFWIIVMSIIGSSK